MSQIQKAFRSFIVAGSLLATASPAFAINPEITGSPVLDGAILTVLYSLMGILMAALSFRVIDAIFPGDLKHQITNEKNVALGIIVGLQGLGICIIIAAAIAG